jgi:glycosyltransferase involved in cell wall biosynthesis
MKYSFFGTCFEDSKILLDCLKSIANQSLEANEIILIDASMNSRIYLESKKFFEKSNTKFIYKNINLPRVEALNYAISLSKSDFLLRFDSRTRFSKEYAKLALKYLNEKHSDGSLIGGVGGRQSAYPINSSRGARLASDLMDRAYIFGNPLYRRRNYKGKVNSIYLGCFPKKILEETPYREDVSLISEDTQLCQDIISKGYGIYIFQDLKLKYLCRDNFLSLIKLFRSYGRCRARTIISTKTIHDKKKYSLMILIVIILPIFILLALGKKIIVSLLLIAFLPLTYNIFHELMNYGPKKLIYIPFLGLIIQTCWALGFFEALLLFKFYKKRKSNFLK